jgi:hypothetical protein
VDITSVMVALLSLDALVCVAVFVFWIRSDRRADRNEVFTKERWRIEDERYVKRMLLDERWLVIHELEVRLADLAAAAKLTRTDASAK